MEFEQQHCPSWAARDGVVRSVPCDNTPCESYTHVCQELKMTRGRARGGAELPEFRWLAAEAHRNDDNTTPS